MSLLQDLMSWFKWKAIKKGFSFFKRKEIPQSGTLWNKKNLRWKRIRRSVKTVNVGVVFISLPIIIIQYQTLLSESCSEPFEKALRAVLRLRTINRKVPQSRTITASRRVLNDHLSRITIPNFVKSNYLNIRGTLEQRFPIRQSLRKPYKEKSTTTVIPLALNSCLLLPATYTGHISALKTVHSAQKQQRRNRAATPKKNYHLKHQSAVNT